MTQEERLAQLLDGLPDSMLQQALENQGAAPLPRFPWKRIVALAACAAVALGLGFGLNARRGGAEPPTALESHSPSQRTEPVITPMPQTGEYISQELIFSMLPVGERIAEYHRVDSPSAYFSIQEPYLELEGWFRAAEHDGLRYLIHQGEDGSYTLWEFSHFLVWSKEELADVTASLTSDNSFWSEISWFSPDMAVEPYPYAEVLEQVYGVTSAEDIISITLTPGNMDNTDAGKALQAEIGAQAISDRADIAAVYDALVGMTCLGSDHWELIDLGEQSDSGLLHSVEVTRYLTLKLTDGSKITALKYTGAGGQFYEYQGIAYAPLDTDTAAKLNTLFRITP